MTDNAILLENSFEKGKFKVSSKTKFYWRQLLWIRRKIERLIKKIKNETEKKDIINSLAINKKDVGSAEVQIGLLSDKIEKLSGHFKKFKKDKHSTVGLTKSVNKRKKLLSYLKKKNPNSYDKIIKQLGLRK